MDKHCVFVLHGSRSFEVRSATDRLKEQLLKKLNISFSICYLTYNTPNLFEALEEAFANGFHDIICFPLFILPGQHIREDIPDIIDDFKKKHQQCKITILPSIVENNIFVDFIAKTINKIDDK